MAHEVPNITLNNGVEIPSIGLGVFQTPPDETRSAVAAALDAGYRHIDTAAAYGNEREVGEAVHASEVGRAAVFLETKIWISDCASMRVCVTHLGADRERRARRADRTVANPTSKPATMETITTTKTITTMVPRGHSG